MKRFFKLRFMIPFIVVVFVLFKLLNIELIIDSHPPSGCNKIEGVFGGCFAKQGIPFQLSYSMRRCLKISTNPCNGPNIQLHNQCRDEIFLNDEIYKSNDRYINLSQENKRGLVINNGRVGNGPFYIISYISAPKCQ